MSLTVEQEALSLLKRAVTLNNDTPVHMSNPLQYLYQLSLSLFAFLFVRRTTLPLLLIIYYLSIKYSFMQNTTVNKNVSYK